MNNAMLAVRRTITNGAVSIRHAARSEGSFVYFSTITPINATTLLNGLKTVEIAAL
jgi:hypothetical protein